MFDFDAARRLPPRIRFGCSSWKYPGWKGQVYLRDYSSKTRFEAECIAEYGAFPWFRAVGLDHCFYRPPTARQLQSYASQTPADLQWLPNILSVIKIIGFAEQQFRIS